MSAGDIDDRLGPEGELERLANEFPLLAEYLAKMDSLPIHKGQTPFGAGISEDGQIRYIDPRLNTILDVVDVSPIIAVHESVEWALRTYCNIGVDYANDSRGHRLANRAEYEKCTALGIDWEAYDDLLDPQIAKLEALDLIAVPEDLAMYPYESDEDLEHEVGSAKGKFSKSSVQYTNLGGPDFCKDCINFEKDDCALVSGEISPDGWCEEYDTEKLA